MTAKARRATSGAKACNDPRGGLTAAGRAYYKQTEGANLKPGVKKRLSKMTPEEMKRKGSFLRRHYANLRGPLADEDGRPTRLALQARAWGEPVPRSEEAARKLAEKGTRLLERYRKAKEKVGSPGRKAKAKKDESGKSASKAQPKGSSPAVYTDPKLRDRLKAEIQAGDKGGRPGQWSARKSQLLASAYERAGGSYQKGKKTGAQKDLDQWTEEGWTTRDGEPAARDGETARYLPEAAWEEMTPAQRRATDKKKRAGSREGRQHVANTGAARQARKRAGS